MGIGEMGLKPESRFIKVRMWSFASDERYAVEVLLNVDSAGTYEKYGEHTRAVFPGNGGSYLIDAKYEDIERLLLPSRPTLLPPDVPEWRPATIDDAIRAIRGETVEARFRQDPGDVSYDSRLCGYDTDPPSHMHWISDGRRFRHCEVRNRRG